VPSIKRRIRKDQVDFTEPHASKTGLQRLYNSLYLSDYSLQARASSQRARDHHSPADLQKSLGLLGAAYLGLTPLPTYRRALRISCSQCTYTITTMHWNYRQLPVKLKTQALSCNSAGGIDKLSR